MSRYKSKVNRYLLQLQRGDKKKFDVLYNVTANHLGVVAKRYVYNEADVDDVLIDAYMRIYNSISAFDAHKDGYNWMCKIVQNAAFTANAALRKKQAHETFLADTANVLYDDDQRLDAVLQGMCFSQAMRETDKTDKQIFYLRFYENASEREIAQQVDMSAANVHKRLKKIEKVIKIFWQNGKQKR